MAIQSLKDLQFLMLYMLFFCKLVCYVFNTIFESRVLMSNPQQNQILLQSLVYAWQTICCEFFIFNFSH
jgi:hypothetical protein